MLGQIWEHKQGRIWPCYFREVANLIAFHHNPGRRDNSGFLWFKTRCPACGMTTSWACLTKGRVLDSFASNAGGALLAITAAVAGPWSLVSGLRGKWLWGPVNEKTVIVVAGSILAVTLMDWCYRLLTR